MQNAIGLENEIEAQRFAAILDEEEIPHQIVTYHDSAYDGLFQMQKGWGHIASSAEYIDRIAELYEAMKA